MSLCTGMQEINCRSCRTTWGKKGLISDPRFSSWLNRFSQQENLTDTERIQCLRDLEEVHSFASIVNRTRRRDIGKFTIREPHTVTIHFDETQQKFYDKLIDFRREFLSLFYDPIVIRLITDILERQAETAFTDLSPFSITLLNRENFPRIQLPIQQILMM